MVRSPGRRLTALALGTATSVALALAGCTTPGSAGEESTDTISQSDIDAALQEPTKLTFWSWLPNVQKAVDAYEAEFPAIDVVVEDPSGGGGGQEQVVRTAVEAGTGIPDVVQLSQGSVSSFVLSEDLLDLTPYGAAELEDQFVESAWASVAFDGGIYGTPQDLGPMAVVYRTDILEAAGITDFPTTWEEFAEASQVVKDRTGAYLTNFGAIQSAALPQQAEQPLYDWSGGEDVTIAVDNPEVLEIAEYWQGLIDADLVSTDAEFTDPWYQGLASGKYASWITAAWGPIFLQGTAATTAGQWAAVPLPQWDGAEPSYPSAGGSATSVMKASENPIAAAHFAQWLNADPEATALLTDELGLFPSTTALLADDEWRSRPHEFFAGQAINEVFGDAAEQMEVLVTPPFNEYLAASSGDTIAAALANRDNLPDAYRAWQQGLVDFATEQGFTVNEG